MQTQDSTAPAPSARRIATSQDARGLVVEVLAALETLDRTLSKETELMGSGRIHDALALVETKQSAAAVYMRLLTSVKANAIALARFAPEGVDAMKIRHGAFSRALHLNQTVIATVKSVSETLVRSLQSELNATRSLSVYGPGARAETHGPSTAPIALSVRL